LVVTAVAFNSTLNQLADASLTMDLTLSDKERAFQTQVRAFIAERLPVHIKRKVEDGLQLIKEDYVSWQKILYECGWMAPNWPKQYGGTGWTPIERYLFEEELALGSTPRIIPFGVAMVGPVIIEFGTEAQKQCFLPRILSSEDLWCQGYSEPGAGSDLASLTTRARRDGKHYIVNGAKTWTTMAHYADWIFCLVRTDGAAKKQEGISFLLIDMHSPGVSVRPIRTFDGGEEINEVYFDDVRVPAENLVGEENKGWTYAKFLLDHERTGITGVAHSKKQLARVKTLAASELCDGRSLLEQKRFREKIAAVEVDLMALEYTNLRIVCAEQAGETMAAESSILKFRGTELQQAITELLLEVIGYYSHPYVPQAIVQGWSGQAIGPHYAASIAPLYFNWRKTSIYGGTNEIQKNIIAKMVLGL
jgi:alkylation response protein AidB-like acyl-CoA dehydrogenase